MVAFASSFYTGILLPLPETLVVIDTEVVESFTIDYRVSLLKYISDNEYLS